MEYLITIRQLRDRTYALRLGAVRSPELSLVHIVSNPLTFLSITKAVLRMNYKFQAHLFDGCAAHFLSFGVALHQ
jgi:hypothetical protein